MAESTAQMSDSSAQPSASVVQKLALPALIAMSYVNEGFDDERPDFTDDPDLLVVRNDELWNFGGCIVWRFAPGWSLRPTFEYNWEESNIPALAYSSTEVWLTVRREF